MDTLVSEFGYATDNVAVLTFTPANWATPQAVAVAARDDRVDEGGDQVMYLYAEVSAPGDGNYDLVTGAGGLRAASCALSQSTADAASHPGLAAAYAVGRASAAPALVFGEVSVTLKAQVADYEAALAAAAPREPRGPSRATRCRISHRATGPWSRAPTPGASRGRSRRSRTAGPAKAPPQRRWQMRR